VSNSGSFRHDSFGYDVDDQQYNDQCKNKRKYIFHAEILSSMRENSARTVVRLASFIIFCKTELSGKSFPYSRERTLL